MGRQKRGSKSLDKAKLRLGALASIDLKLDLGNGLTVTAYKGKIDALESGLDDYNGHLSEADALLSDMADNEKQIDDLSDRMLAGVGVKFGRNSLEYQKAGGTRKSDRKRRVTNGNGQTPTPTPAHN